MLAFRVPSPRTGKILSAAIVAADFGPKNPWTRQALEALHGGGVPNPVETYYTLVLDSFAARATGANCEFDRVPRDVAQPVFRRVCEYSLPEHPVDLFKELYPALFSKASRHGLGEYYTPDWLAERLLAQTLGQADFGDPSKRVLDPACGSGAFLVLLIGEIRRRVRSREALELILRNVVGFDVNPLAVRTARTNYLCALGDLLRYTPNAAEVPVYETDSVLGGKDLPAFDFIVGNPPWVNWQDLPDAYRRQSMPLWERYGLFPRRKSAMQTILGSAKYDFSMLMTYVAADRYLRDGGRLGFIVSQALFKAASAGEGFRRFRLPDGTPLGVSLVEDLVRLKPFASAANRTALLVLEKGRETRYPVEYRFHTADLQCRWSAQPVAVDPSSAWITARPGALSAIARILGRSDYRAREGANTGGANAVFWMDVVVRSGARVTIRNFTENARKQAPRVRAAVESELVYPLLRGRNVERWSAAADHSVLITHRPGMKLRAIPEAEMRKTFPGAYSYVRRFRSLLLQRPAYKRYFKPDAPFYSLFNIGDYTFAPWKVVWREQALPFTAAVAGPAGRKITVPDHKLMIVAVDSEDEAHYLCGALNSLPVSAAVAAYAIETQINTHVLEHVRVPRFNPADAVHHGLASASRQAHDAARAGSKEQLQAAEAELDRHATALWSLTGADLAELRAFLREAGLPCVIR